MKTYKVAVKVVTVQYCTLVVESDSEENAQTRAEEIFAEYDYAQIEEISHDGFQVEDESLDIADVHEISAACNCAECKAYADAKVITLDFI